MSKVQELDNLMQQYIVDDIKSDILLDKMHSIYNTLDNTERKDLYSLVKDRDTNWKHALINFLQIHRNENATREEYNDVIIACFDVIDSCYNKLEIPSFSEKEYIVRRCIYFLSQFHKNRLTNEEIERLKKIVFYIKLTYENNVKSLENLEKLLTQKEY